MANLTTVRKIAKLGNKGRELRITAINGEEKYDIRKWNGEEPEDGVRFTEDELKMIANNQTNINGKTLIFDLDTMEWGVAIVVNGTTHKRMFASDYEMDLIKQAVNMLFSKQIQKSSEKKTTTAPAKKAEKKKEYINGYAKFKDQFEEFRKNQPDNRKAAYKSTHDLVLAQIKERCAEDEEYNKAALQDCKNSYELSEYCLEKQFENYEIHDYDEQCELLKQWVDEYILKEEKKTKKK